MLKKIFLFLLLSTMAATAQRSTCVNACVNLPTQTSGNVELIGGMTFQGTWSSSTTYAKNQVVVYGSPVNGYISLINGNLNNIPSSSPSDWAVFATGTASAAGFYQFFANAGTTLTQRNTANFNNGLQAVDNSGAARTDISPVYGTGAGTVMQGNDSRVLTAVPNTRNVLTSAPLTGGGPLSSDITIVCPTATGTQAGCIAAADWARFNSGLTTAFYQTVQNSTTSITQRGKLNFTGGLQAGDNSSNGSSDITPVYGIVAGTVAQGNDSRIVNAVQNTRNVNTTSPLTGGGALSSDRTIAINQANGSQAGYLTSGNWTSFDTVNYTMVLLDWVDTTDSGKLQFECPTACHITRVYASVVGATNAVINLDKRAEGTPNTDSGNHLLSSDLTAVTTGATSTSFANGAGQCGGTSSCAIAAHTMVVLTVTSVSGAVAGDALRVIVEVTSD